MNDFEPVGPPFRPRNTQKATETIDTVQKIITDHADNDFSRLGVKML